MAGHTDEPDQKALEEEILALTRKGLWTTTPQYTPALRQLLGIPEEYSNLQALPMIRAGILEAAKVLPAEHLIVFRESSGAEAGSPFGRERRLAAAAR